MGDFTMLKKSEDNLTEKHGIHSFEKHGPQALSPDELESLQQLRELVSTEPGRMEIKIEVISRLMIIARKFFGDAASIKDDPKWWESGIVGRGATYLAELRRWLDTIPPEKRDILDADSVLAVYRDDTDNPKPEEGKPDASNS